ncbi:MAG: hypothetical protein ACLFTA_03755 [Candidatus Nanohaloarchaea archaeon]
MKWIRNYLFRVTPLGRADQDLKAYLKDKKFEEERLAEYEKSLGKYRANKAIHNIVKLFLYAGIVTSIATTFGIEQARYIAQAASYIGVTLLLMMYALTLYLSELYREEYHVKREILISEVKA